MAGTSSPPSPALPLLLRPPPLGRASPLGHLPAPPEPRADADWLAGWDRHAGPCLLSAPGGLHGRGAGCRDPWILVHGSPAARRWTLGEGGYCNPTDSRNAALQLSGGGRWARAAATTPTDSGDAALKLPEGGRWARAAAK